MNTLMTHLETRLLSVEEYHKMMEAGILTEDERVELLAGNILSMSPIGSKHIMCVNRLTRLLSAIAGEVAIVSVQNPISLSPLSEPEPDVALWKAPIDRYDTALPQAEDIYLVIEVADSSLSKDREIKLPLYAEAGIVELWLVDLVNSQVEIFTEPKGTVYALRRIAQRGDSIPVTVLGTEIKVDDLLEKV